MNALEEQKTNENHGEPEPIEPPEIEPRELENPLDIISILVVLGLICLPLLLFFSFFRG